MKSVKLMATLLIICVLLVLPLEAKQLHSAAYRGDLATVRQYLSGDHNVNERDSSGVAPLHYAAQMSHVDAMGLLIAGGSDVDIQTAREANTPLHLTSSAGHGYAVIVDNFLA